MSNKRTIAFLENKLTLRGTSVALYDYADYNERLLGNTSLIITRSYQLMKDSRDVDNKAYDKFTNRFPVIYYNDPSEIDSIVKDYTIDVLFIEKSGRKEDMLLTDKCKTIIHCVFETDEPHGSYYCGLSEWLNIRNTTNIPILHYMVTIPNITTNLREQLGIPSDALVFGSYGGSDEITPYIRQCIIDISNNPNYSNIYFLFMNIPPFYHNSTNLRFIEGTSDMNIKRQFINTCDAMVYGRVWGETFGLAIGEFSICDKPVIANSDVKDKYHIQTLEDNIILHKSYGELYDILTNYPNYKRDVSSNKFKIFTPDYVMKEFSAILDILYENKV